MVGVQTRQVRLCGPEVVAALVAVAVVAAILPGPSHAKTGMGSQRVGTSSGSFLRIGLGARPASMAGAFVAICDDISACAWNPAGLVHLENGQLALNHISWAADIGYSHACYGMPVRSLDGAVAIQFGSLSADLWETQEYHPYGTGREFTFSDWLIGMSLAKRFTDRFSGGIAAKYVREDLGVEVGGPSTDAVVLDAGTQYEIGPRNMHLAVALMNFGPDMAPKGSYAMASGGNAQYEGYAPSTEFKFGVAFSPITRPWLTSVVDLEMCHPADNAETFRLGAEAVILGTLAVRGGHDFRADELKTSMGVGITTTLLAREASMDYGATFSQYLGTVHRFSLTVGISREPSVATEKPPEVAKMEPECAALASQLQEEKDKLEQTESCLAAEQATIRDLKTQIEAADTQIRDVEDRIAALDQEITQLEALPTEWVVKRGECLYVISGHERVYGDPVKWPRLYEANKDKVENPDLIYPGQVLTIPR